MSGFFEAFNNWPKPDVKKYMVTLQGKEIEVSLQQKLEIIRMGEDKYMLENGKIILKPVQRKTDRKFPVLCRHSNGLGFHDKDPHWVQGVIKEGYKWQIESE